MNDSDAALVKYATEVHELLRLYRLAQVTLDRSALQHFNVQFNVVECLTLVAMLPVIRVDDVQGGQ